jgi:hypothetical protein
MIVQWKQEGPILYHAEWMKMQLDLAWDYDTSKWRCWVDGKRVKQCWDSVTAAKAGVDTVVTKLLSNGPVVPVVDAERPRLTMQGLVSIMASLAVVRMRQAADDAFSEALAAENAPAVHTQVGHIGSTRSNLAPQGAASGRIRGNAPNLTEVERA